MVATEAAVKAHVPGLQDTVPQGGGADHDDGKRRQSNRDRRSAKKRKFQADMEELRTFRQSQGKGHQQSGGGKDSGGKGKSKSKDQTGAPLCFSWAAGTGTCGNLPPGAECAAAIKRVHKCRKCLSPSHQDASCPKG